MKKGNSSVANDGVSTVSGRITRARAATLKENVKVLIGKSCLQQDQGRPPRPPFKKRKAVLQDATNVSCTSQICGSINTVRNIKKAKKADVKIWEAEASIESHDPKDFVKIAAETNLKTVPRPESKLINLSATVGNRSGKQAAQSKINHGIQSSKKPSLLRCAVLKARKSNISHPQNKSSDPVISDLDADHKDPQLCTLYAPEIYNYHRVAELNRRPSLDYMETKQQDISPSMRGILVDWLVEVSEEYKLSTDTLYLTVYLVDWFLSNNVIERQRLQLLGITSMLIASKYEEICAPRIEDFCFVTDNTYTKEEVLKMETQVLTVVNFQLYTPSVKNFLRRFVRAAQASYENPSLDLEHLADYLAELTLVDYAYLKYLPSTIAASAVFLARWTLDQSTIPWNATLEYYTSYKPIDLKSSVLALRDLQLNTNNCPLHVIRAKYSQQKFNAVSCRFSPNLPENLF